jgi:hypothetical protein
MVLSSETKGPAQVTRRPGLPGRRRQDMADKDKDMDPLALTEELFAFLQGKVPEGYKIKRRHVPRLTEDQAWTVIWYCANLGRLDVFDDSIERCDVCGTLYNRNSSGDCLDYGRAPYSFCDNCMDTEQWYKKARRNPDKNLRPSRTWCRGR